MNDTFDIDGDTVTKTVHYTPNVTIENPKVRRIANAVLGSAMVVTAAVMAGDALSVDIDLTRVTIPLMGVLGSLAGGYGLIVTQPNIPRA